MKLLNESLAAIALAVVIAGAVPSCNLDGIHHEVERNVMLKGSDPVAYFKQGKAVMGNLETNISKANKTG